MNTVKRNSSFGVRRLVIAAVCLALCWVLPFLTGQIPEIGSMLSPMHLPVLLCGFLAGPALGGVVGLVAPLTRSLMFGMPPILPATAMAFEMAAYGVVAGCAYILLLRMMNASASTGRRFAALYVSLVCAQIVGRLIWGAARVVLLGLGNLDFSWAIFITSGFVEAIPGIIVQLVLVPILVVALEKARLVPKN